MHSNLKAEMARNSVTVKDLAKAIGKTEKTASAKICGKYDFTLPECIEIRNRFFPDCSIEYLFQPSTGV